MEKSDDKEGGEEEVRLDWKDYVAVILASLQTTLLPFILLIIILIVFVLLVSFLTV